MPTPYPCRASGSGGFLTQREKAIFGNSLLWAKIARDIIRVL